MMEYWQQTRFCFVQTLADLEQRWRNEVEEHSQQNVSSSAPFFHDYHLQDVGSLLSDAAAPTQRLVFVFLFLPQLPHTGCRLFTVWYCNTAHVFISPLLPQLPHTGCRLFTLFHDYHLQDVGCLLSLPWLPPAGCRLFTVSSTTTTCRM